MDTKNCTESSSNGIAIENDHRHSGFKWIYPLNMVIFQNSSGITSYLFFSRPLGCWRWVRWWPEGLWTPCSMVWRWGKMGEHGGGNWGEISKQLGVDRDWSNELESWGFLGCFWEHFDELAEHHTFDGSCVGEEAQTSSGKLVLAEVALL